MDDHACPPRCLFVRSVRSVLGLFGLSPVCPVCLRGWAVRSDTLSGNRGKHRQYNFAQCHAPLPSLNVSTRAPTNLRHSAVAIILCHYENITNVAICAPGCCACYGHDQRWRRWWILDGSSRHCTRSNTTCWPTHAGAAALTLALDPLRNCSLTWDGSAGSPYPRAAVPVLSLHDQPLYGSGAHSIPPVVVSDRRLLTSCYAGRLVGDWAGERRDVRKAATRNNPTSR